MEMLVALAQLSFGGGGKTTELKEGKTQAQVITNRINTGTGILCVWGMG